VRASCRVSSSGKISEANSASLSIAMRTFLSKTFPKAFGKRSPNVFNRPRTCFSRLRATDC
jgi:hypothetical protein